MALQSSFLSCSVRTFFTAIRLLPSVYLHVPSEPLPCGGSIGTLGAGKWLFSCVCSDVLNQGFFGGGLIYAVDARIRLLSSVNAKVVLIVSDVNSVI